MGDHGGIKHVSNSFLCLGLASLNTRLQGRNRTHPLPVRNPSVRSTLPIPNPFCGEDRIIRQCDRRRCGDTSDGIKTTSHFLEIDFQISERNANGEKSLKLIKMIHWPLFPKIRSSLTKAQNCYFRAERGLQIFLIHLPVLTHKRNS